MQIIGNKADCHTVHSLPLAMLSTATPFKDSLLLNVLNNTIISAVGMSCNTGKKMLFEAFLYTYFMKKRLFFKSIYLAVSSNLGDKNLLKFFLNYY